MEDSVIDNHGGVTLASSLGTGVGAVQWHKYKRK